MPICTLRRGQWLTIPAPNHAPMVDAAMIASELSLTNQLEELPQSGNFGKAYPGYTWTAAITEVQTNRLFDVHYEVHLTGDKDVIHNLVGTSFLPPDTTGEFSYMPGNFAHVQRIVLVDKAGRIVSYFDGLNQEAANTVIEQIKKLESSP